MHERLHEPELLPVPSRQLAHRPVERSVETCGELVPDATVHTAAQRGEEVEDRRAREPRVELEVTREEAHSAADLEALPAGVEAEHGRRAGRRPDEVEEQAHRRRLPGAVRAEEPEQLTPFDVEVQVEQAVPLPEVLREGTRTDGDVGRHRNHAMRGARSPGAGPGLAVLLACCCECTPRARVVAERASLARSMCEALRDGSRADAADNAGATTRTPAAIGRGARGQGGAAGAGLGGPRPARRRPVPEAGEPHPELRRRGSRGPAAGRRRRSGPARPTLKSNPDSPQWPVRTLALGTARSSTWRSRGSPSTIPSSCSTPTHLRRRSARPPARSRARLAARAPSTSTSSSRSISW